MRFYSEPNSLSRQHGIATKAISEADDFLSKSFTMTDADELKSLGIDRVLFLNLIQYSAFYHIDAVMPDPEHFYLPLKDSDNQPMWVHQSYAQWLIVLSVPRNKIFIFSMADVKTQFLNWSQEYKLHQTYMKIPWIELKALCLKEYAYTMSDSVKDAVSFGGWLGKDDSSEVTS